MKYLEPEGNMSHNIHVYNILSEVFGPLLTIYIYIYIKAQPITEKLVDKTFVSCSTLPFSSPQTHSVQLESALHLFEFL
jgi:hypothetical protein